MKVCKEILRDVLTAFILWEIRRAEGHSTHQTIMEKHWVGKSYSCLFSLNYK